MKRLLVIRIGSVRRDRAWLGTRRLYRTGIKKREEASRLPRVHVTSWIHSDAIPITVRHRSMSADYDE
jgi:hypothetical protein